MRYNRNDYSACDWKATKSDHLRTGKDAKPFLSALTVAKWAIAVVLAICAFASFFHWLQKQGVIQ